MKENKYFAQSETVTLKRSEIHPSSYNPRMIDDEGKKQLKRSIKRYGCVGGIVVNKRTGNTIVGLTLPRRSRCCRREAAETRA